MWWAKLFGSIAKTDTSNPLTMLNIQDVLDAITSMFGG